MQLSREQMLAIFFFMIGLILIFGPDIRSLNLVLFGSSEISSIPSDNAKFGVPAKTRCAIGLTFLVGAMTLLGTKVLLANVADDFERERALFAKNEREVISNIEKINSEIATEARDNRLDELESRFDELQRLALKREMFGFSGTNVETLGDKEYQSTTIGVEDKFGQEKLLVVVHLFKNQAHWKLSSAMEFESAKADESEYEFLKLLQSPEAKEKFSIFDLVVGVGLSSNTPRDEKSLAERRANFLCTAIYSSGAVTSPELSAGLIAGQYTGNQAKATTPLEIRQRPLIIIGIDVIDPEANVEALLSEIMNEVTIPGIDFSLYENIRSDEPLHWVTNSNCTPEFGFLRGQTLEGIDK
jgi:hypothetical protein